MIKATISETKNRLSALLDLVRSGETILILDRDNPIAQITPLSVSVEECYQNLLRNGIISPPTKKSGRLPALIPGDGQALLSALLKERDESR